jgi:hypothetical protein
MRYGLLEKMELFAAGWAYEPADRSVGILYDGVLHLTCEADGWAQQEYLEPVSPFACHVKATCSCGAEVDYID